MMKDRQAFWDASAVVPLCLQQDISPRARQLLRKYPDPVVWWATLAEVRSAIARAVRVGRADADKRRRALYGLDHLTTFWHEVDPNNTVRTLALDLLDDHQLRTGDALQLAAALAWCREKPHRRVFICFDERLATVAEEVGFTIIQA